MMTPSEKLENCEVCAKDNAKYTCPKCEVRTCSLTCVNIHKKELNCDGIRDKTKFVPLNKFTDLDLLSDYRLLEEVGRSVDKLQRDETKKFTKSQNLPQHLFKLKQAANRSKVNIEYMPQNFSRHKQNTTYFNWKTNELFWRIEWIFSQAENSKWVTHRALETLRLSSLLENVLDPLNSKDVTDGDLDQKKILYDKLQFYRSAGLSGLRVFLKAEKVKRSDSRFYELDVTQSLKDNLENKTIIEFPIIYVALKDHADMFETIDSDEEKEVEEPEQTTSNWKNRRKHHQNRNQEPQIKKEPIDIKKEPVNFFFNDNASDSETEAMDQS